MKHSFVQAMIVLDTATWMHYMEANKTCGEKYSWQLRKNAASNIEQVLEAAPNRETGLRPPTAHHQNYKN